MITKLTAPILHWFDQHANPIALQEVRHLLSLTRTMIVYGLLVFGLWVSSCNTTGSADSLPFFMIGAFGVVGVALFPAQTLFINSTRWSVDKMEMLHLTELRPMDIVLGRVLAGFSILMIFGSILLPFLALTYLLPGTQIGVVLLGFAVVILMALLANVFTLNVAWQMEAYSFSSLLKVFWLLVLFQASFAPAAMMTAMMETGSAWMENFWKVAPWVLMGWTIMMYYGVARSVVLLRHPESNRSTPIRIGVLLMTLMGWAAIYSVHTVERELIFGGTAVGLFLVSLVCFSFVIEPSNPGRKTLVELPERKRFRWLLFPLLPTSGTGVLFTGLLLLGTASLGEILLYVEDPISERWVGIPSYIASCLFGYLCLILPRFCDSPILYNSNRRRLALILYPPLTFIPFLLLAFIGQTDGPFKVFFTYIVPFTALDDKHISLNGFVWACFIVSLTLAVNFASILKSRKSLIDTRLEDLEENSRQSAQ